MSLSLQPRKGPEMADATTQISSSTDALMQEFNIITHNLANVSTVGYKRICNAFTKALEAQGTAGATYSPESIGLNSALDFSQGTIVETGRPLDLALYGKAFFVIETPAGPLYTRNGTFHTNQNGQIVDSNGRIVAGEAGPISIPSGAALSQLSIASDGTISAGQTVIGKFRLANFADNENKLVPAGASCFKLLDETVQPTPAENVVVKQGYQEASNVEMIDELVNMIIVSRLYEANMKLLSAQKETSSSIMNVAMG
jgi:flagellar basal-body rod protein FlgF